MGKRQPRTTKKPRCFCVGNECGKGIRLCKRRFCKLCNGMHSLRRKCKTECCCGFYGVVKCNKRGALCVSRKKSKLYLKIQNRKKRIGDSTASEDERERRLNIIEDEEIRMRVNNTIKEMYCIKNIENEVCAACGRFNKDKDLTKMNLENEALLEVFKWRGKKEEARTLSSRTTVLTRNDDRLILAIEGCDIEGGYAKFCIGCTKSLTKSKKATKFSYVKIDPGTRPTLPVLTVAESMLLSSHRVSAIVYRVMRGAKSDEERQRCLKGHCLSLFRPEVSWLFNAKLDGQPLINAGIDKIGDTLKVVCMSYVKNVEEAHELMNLAKDIHVRTNVIREWMAFLKAFHKSASYEFKEGMMLSKIANAETHVNGVPKVLLVQINKSTINTKDPYLDEDESVRHEGYAKHDDKRGNIDPAEWPESDGQCNLTNSFVVADSPRFTVDGVAFTQVQELVSTSMPGWWYLSFPSLFPYGHGYPKKGEMSLQVWVDLMCNRVDRRFVRHHNWLFVAGNLIMRDQVFKATRWVVPRERAEELAKLSDGERKMLARVLSGERKLEGVSLRVLRVAKMARTGVKSIPKSSSKMEQKRYIITNGFVPLFGPANLFLTLNFNTEKHILRLCFGDVAKIKFQLEPKIGIGRTKVNHLSSSKIRRVEAAADPVLEAKTFDYLVTGVMKYLFGATEELRLVKFSGYSKKRRGVLGSIQWYMGIPETNQRKTLHAHFLIRIWELDAKFLGRKISDPNFRTTLENFIDSILDVSLVPDIDFAPKVKYDEDERQVKRKLKEFTKKLTHEESVRRKADRTFEKRKKLKLVEPFIDEPQMMVPCLLPKQHGFESNDGVKRVLAIQSRTHQFHKCSYTCFKTAEAKLKKRCRLRQVNCKLTAKTKVHKETGEVVLRRHLRRSVVTNKALSYVSGCNTNLQVMPLREVVAAHYYVIAYSTKLDGMQAVDLTHLQKSYLRKLDYIDDEGEESNKKALQGLSNSLLSSMVFSGQEMGAFCCGLPEEYLSHESSYLDWYALIEILNKNQVIKLESFHDGSPSSTIPIPRKGNVRDFVLEYAAVDSEFSPFEIKMLFKKVEIRDIGVKLNETMERRFLPRFDKYEKYKLQLSNITTVPVLSGRKLPELESPLFALFVVAVFTPIVSKSMKESIQLNTNDVQAMYHKVVEEDPFVAGIVENIAAWQKACKQAKELVQQRKKEEEEVGKHDGSYSSDSEYEYHSDEEFQFMDGYKEFKKQLAKESCIIRKNQYVNADSLAISTQIPDFDIDLLRELVECGSSKTELKIDQYTKDRLAFLNNNIVAQFPEVKSVINSFGGVQLKGVNCDLKRQKSNADFDKVGWSEKCRKEWKTLCKTYRQWNKDADVLETKASTAPATEEKKSFWYSYDPCARCLDANEWDEVAKIHWFEKQKRLYNIDRSGVPKLSVSEMLKNMVKSNKWIRLKEKSGHDDIIKACTLTAEQALPFLIFAKHVDELIAFVEDPSRNSMPEQLLLTIDGMPGSGKSYVLKAMQLYLYQCRWDHFATGSAQTAKAALNMTSPAVTAQTNHSLFGFRLRERLNGKAETVRMAGSTQLLRSRFKSKLILFIDECSMIPSYLFGMINTQLQSALGGDCAVMGGRTVVMFGDQCQLNLGTPLYKQIVVDGEKKERRYIIKTVYEKTSEVKNDEWVGRQMWLRFKCMQLLQVNRFLNDSSGQKLAEIIMAWRHGVVREKHVEWLNSCYIGNKEDFCSKKWTQHAYFVHPRNKVLTEVAPIFQMAAGLSENKLVYVWQSVDRYECETCATLTKEDYVTAGKRDFKETDGYRTLVYYEGCTYVFKSNMYKKLGWLNQNEAIACGIEFHPQEEFRRFENSNVVFLSHQPTSLSVKPVGELFNKTLKLMKTYGKFKIKSDTKHNGLASIIRHGFTELLPGRLKTDFGCQCMTIRNPYCMLTDLTMPVTGRLKDGSLLVIISRVQTLKQIGLIYPLYSNAAEKQQYIKQLTNHVQLSEDKLKELKRLEKASTELKKTNHELWNRAKNLGHCRDNCTTFPSVSEYLCKNSTSSKLDRRSVNAKKFRSLRPGEWIDDTVINAYFKMLQDNSNGKVYCFSTFFMTKLLENGVYTYKNVAKWTLRRKIDILTKEKLLIPINVANAHWVLVLVDVKEKAIIYYDSFHKNDLKHYTKHVRQYLRDQSTDLGNHIYGWNRHISYAYCLAANLDFTIQENDMTNFRMRIASQIVENSNGST